MTTINVKHLKRAINKINEEFESKAELVIRRIASNHLDSL
jgi:hypothetical protein